MTDARFQDLIQRIQNAKFRTTRLTMRRRLRPGYVRQDVDSLLHEIAEAATQM